MAKKYPHIESIRPRKKNTQAKCRCGALGQYRPEIQVSYMRGDDVVVWACDTHKKDADFLLQDWDFNLDKYV